MELQAVVSVARRQRSPRSILKSRVASALCLAPAVYLSGIVLFALWNFQDYATEWPQLLRYVVVPTCLCALFLGIALFGSRIARVMLGGTALALLLAMFAFEVRLESRYVSALVGLAHVPLLQQMQNIGAAQGLPPAHTIKKLNREMGAKRLADAVLSGMPGKRVLLCSQRGQPVLYQADRYGFRNPDAVYGRPVDRMMLGDSFVEGICLPDGSDLVGQVRRLGGNVVGIGTRGAGPLMELAMMGRFGPVIRPKWVVIAFYEGNDWQNLGHEIDYVWLQGALAADADFGPAAMTDDTRKRAEDVIGEWAVKDRPKAAWALRKANLLRNSLALHQTWTQLGLGYPKAARSMPVYNQILARTNAIAAQWGGRAALLYIPQTSRFTGLVADGFVYDEVRRKILSAAARNRIPVVDLSPVFAAAPERLSLFAADGHLSERGAALAASTLDHALIRGDRK